MDEGIIGIPRDPDFLEIIAQTKSRVFPRALMPTVARALLHSHTAMSKGQVSNEERRVIREFISESAAFLGTSDLLDRPKKLVSTLRRHVDDENCPFTRLATSVLTNPADCKILAFCLGYLMHPRHHPLQCAIDTIQHELGLPPQLHDCSRSFFLFAGVSEETLVQRLLPNMPLQRSRMLRRDNDGELVIHPNLLRFLASGASGDPWSFLVPDTNEGIFRDFPHAEIDQAIGGIAPLMPALREGVHLRLALLHEPRGRQVAEDALRALARRLGRHLYWVDPNEIALVTQILSHRPEKAILGVLPESPRRWDMFGGDLFSAGNQQEVDSQISEDIHRAPSIIWLCEGLSDDLRNRVDGVLQVKRRAAPGSRLVKNAFRLGGMHLTESEMATTRHIADFLHPAELTRAAARVSLQRGDAAALREELSRIAKVRGLPVPETVAVIGMDAELLSVVENDFEAILEALSRPDAPSAPTFLFTGPPGAGKSVAARLVGQHMGRPVLLKRISELLGMFVSQTERQIVAAFAEADSAGAVLVLDEADSLLFPRQAAVRSWEVSATNTMLVELEARRVPVVCTTNLFEQLDVAALRRFDVKLTFGFLRPDQARMAFERFFGCVAPECISMLKNLTPGDFRTVKARADLLNIKDPAELLRLLRRECEIKPGYDSGRRIGFCA